MPKRPESFQDCSYHVQKHSKKLFQCELSECVGKESAVSETSLFCTNQNRIDNTEDFSTIDSDHVTKLDNSETLPEAPATNEPYKKFDYENYQDYDNDDSSDEDDCANRSKDDDQNRDSQPKSFEQLYPGAPITVSDFVLCIAGLNSRHNLSQECISDILELFSIVCIKPNHCPTSFYKFKQFFSELPLPIEKHFYCPDCVTLIKNTNSDINNDESVEIEEVDNTNLCNCPQIQDKANYFLFIPPDSQLKALYQRDNFYKKLNHKFKFLTNEDDYFRDIYNGSIYKELSADESSILSNKNNISFMWYTDGVQIFRSSKYSVWGFFLIILELPYSERYKIENVLLVALWFGETKPNPNIFLNPLKKHLKKLYKGIEIYVKDLDSKIVIRGIMICGTCDLPAKATFLNMTQFNGRFGCQMCKQEGEIFDKRRIYRFIEILRLRTEKESYEHALQAIEIKQPVCGIKAIPILSKICYRYITSTAVDVMHCIFQGCVKRLGELWFDTQFSKENFSIHDAVDVVDYRLCSIRPPLYVTRRPRPIKTHFSYWKASEYKNWFFYYSLPVLNTILPNELLDHYKYLLLGIYILCQEKISIEQVNLADKLLQEFALRFEHLYGTRHMSCNLHSIRHLADVVRRMGPLWTTSCFPLEDLNGKLKGFVHGSQSPHLQITSNLSMHMKIYTLKNEFLKEGSEVYCFCEKILSPKKKLRLRKANDSVYIVGSVMKLTSSEIQDIKKDYNLPGSNFFAFKKLYKNKILFDSKNNRQDKKTISYIVKYIYNSVLCTGSIQKFVRETTCDCIYYCDCDEKNYALIKKIDTIVPFNVNLQNSTLWFINECVQESNEIYIVDVNDLKYVCYYIEIENPNISYVIEPVNNIEIE